VFDLEQELDRLRDALDAKKIEYALCGGLAMAVHGAPRATIDIDVLIKPDDELNVERAAVGLGYKIKAKPMSFSGGAVEIRRISKIDPTDGEVLMLDMLLVTPAVATSWEGRQTVPWRGGQLSVVSKEGLIALKVFRSSDQDLADIARLRGDT
jgi:hypothetical protein